MSSTFNLKVVTPDKDFYNGEVEMIVVRTVRGDIGILKDHEPLVAPLSVGVMKIRRVGDDFRHVACAGGFISIDEEEVTIVTDSAEWADEIDIERAKQSAERAKQHLDSGEEYVDVLRAKASMARAINRINIAGNIYNRAQ